MAVLIVAASAGWWYWAGRAGAEPKAGGQNAGAPPAAGQGGSRQRIPVEAAAARKLDLPLYLNGLGTVQASNTVLVRSRVDGELIEIGFKEGQTVQEGDLIARIDPRPYQAALDGALAKKKQDEATVSSTRLDLERTRRLATQSFATQQSLDQQTGTVAAQTAQLASDQAAIDNAQTQLSYTTIRAPLSGRAGLRLVDKGNIVRSSDQNGIVEIVQLRPITVIFTAPEGQLSEIQAALREQELKITASNASGATMLGEGTLALVNNSVDVATGTIKLKGVFPNQDDKLWPGLSVSTRLLLRTLSGVVAIPADALQRGQNEVFVFAIGEDDKVEKRVVKIGPFTEGQVVVTDGLREGERVVTAGQSRLQPGAQVEIGGNPARRPEARPDRAADASTPAR